MEKSFDIKKHYAELDDESLAFLLAGGNLVPEAEQALKEELSKRGIDDVSAFKDPADQDLQVFREDVDELKAMPLWRRLSVVLSWFAVLAFFGQEIYLPRGYVYERYGPVVADLEIAVFVICLSWMLAHVPRTSKSLKQ